MAKAKQVRKRVERTLPYFSELTIANFRSFNKESTVPLRPLTIVVGPNSSGKSSLLQALLFLVQSGFLSFWQSSPVWTGPLADLGSFDDTVYGHNKARRVAISATLVGVSKSALELEYSIASSHDAMGILSAATMRDLATGFYIACRRKRGRAHAYSVRSHTRQSLSPSASRDWALADGRDWLPSAMEHVLNESQARYRKGTAIHSAISRLRRVIVNFDVARFSRGTQRVSSGRLPASRWYARGGVDARPNESMFDRVDPLSVQAYDDIEGTIKRPRVPLQKLMSSMGFARSIKAKDLSAYHTSIYVDDYATGIAANLVDVGYGISQAVPVLRALSSGALGPLMIEQPEIHLHPSAQGDMAELLCMASRTRQVIVETHSERIINRARILIARGELKASNVIVLYVNKERSGATVTPIRIDEAGQFMDEWPRGFFDERYEDTMALLSLQKA